MTIDIHATTGLTVEEGREKLLARFNEHDRKFRWSRDETGIEMPVRLDWLENGVNQFDYFNWPDLDLNLMALIVAAMTWPELEKMEIILTQLYDDEDRDEVGFLNYATWLLKLDAPTRFCAALLTVGRE